MREMSRAPRVLAVALSFWGCAHAGHEEGLASDAGGVSSQLPDAQEPSQVTAPLDASALPGDGSVDATPDASDAAGNVAPALPLVSSTRWQVLGPEADPFDDRPALVQCDAASYAPELLAAEPVFGVDTGGCSYITVSQPSLAAAAEGTAFRARIWHFALEAQEPATAHVSVRAGDLTLVDRRVPIPGPGALILVEGLLTAPIAAGTPIYFHLHNHGANSWAFVELSVR